MKVLVDIEFGIIANNYRSACETAAAMGIPKSGWFHATPENLMGRGIALIIEGKGAADYERFAEVEHLRRGCSIVFECRIAEAMKLTSRAMGMAFPPPPDIAALPRGGLILDKAPAGLLARLRARLSAAWAGLRS
ncbi:hypothetical protein [Bosea sp. FBZP-16]|uniref:hypothetical protein n=1 Tax=Bosea sp. FBZP-16 TaxID=2065382 RepID=UPI000C30BAFC|nr:hypothetical protein [Bosea sp. FBZP-16]